MLWCPCFQHIVLPGLSMWWLTPNEQIVEKVKVYVALKGNGPYGPGWSLTRNGPHGFLLSPSWIICLEGTSSRAVRTLKPPHKEVHVAGSEAPASLLSIWLHRQTSLKGLTQEILFSTYARVYHFWGSSFPCVVLNFHPVSFSFHSRNFL